MSRDTGVTIASRSLKGRRILLAVTGGIAAVESVKLARELRRHGAEITPLMSSDATRVISPLALSWGSGTEVITAWESSMAQLGDFDAVLVAPATRNTIAKHLHGIMDSPILMALSASRGNSTPILFVPSMHKDLFDDPVTDELLSSIRKSGGFVLCDSESEGKRKQPNAVSIVAELCHICNSSLPRRKRVAITLGANRAPIDSVRAIQNASSGRTGWAIAEYLHRMGHEVTCIAGKTSVRSTFTMPDVRVDGTPGGMLVLAKELASSRPEPDVWIHAAAVLDYFQEPIDGKKPSGEGDWTITLSQGPKHISELSKLTEGAFRIGFKLEVDSSEDDLIKRSMEQISRYGVDAVIANNLNDLKDRKSPRCRIVMPDGNFSVIQDQVSMCEAIESLVSLHDPR
ncbi:MAG: bifunctional phosphopantothenoylcysteine decarboxylase/phosphopantothenate--cysteine ligase CoaBC [Candidatus Thalassarchaeaceae archaeon]|nr:bifunctional phosphopantothenoylcysteine decarboxylase/phosphopantothenate--cysteine ligase CoaBC [Euryarchaeota archaeon]MDP6871607.1 bifunctional phosphopantothenoylcysteine decarboxylase/phosphopantothenate--cysteine ligase CoaBC [Candidatus Thalassarchaeaceae archaeon]